MQLPEGGLTLETCGLYQGLFDPVALSMHCVSCAVIVSAAHASVPEPGGKALQKGFLCPESGGVVSNLVPTRCSC